MTANRSFDTDARRRAFASVLPAGRRSTPTLTLSVGMSRIEITSADVGGRAEVHQLRSVDADAALRRARQIRHPWYRCQAISSVAEVQRSPTVALRLLAESLSAAREEEEPNRIVSVAAWPLRQLVALDPAKAKAVVEDLLKIISAEPHGLRRLDGLSRIIVAVAEDSELLELTKDPFKAASLASEGWRTERTIAFIASYLAPRDREFALDLLVSRVPNRFRKAAMEKIGDAQDGERV